MTDIPEHLLRRSRERRAALTGDSAPPPEGMLTPTQDAAASARIRSPAAETPRTAAPIPVQLAAPVVGAPPELPPPTDLSPASGTRFRSTRIKAPMLAMLLLLLLPLWAVVYLGAFGSRAKAANSPITAGAGIYNLSCSACHGAAGQGGLGPQLANGAVLKQWPNLQDHINWVKTGGAVHIGEKIGGFIVTASNAMPGFGTALSAAQIADVVCYERVNFGGAPADTNDCPAAA